MKILRQITNTQTIMYNSAVLQKSTCTLSNKLFFSYHTITMLNHFKHKQSIILMYCSTWQQKGLNMIGNQFAYKLGYIWASQL